MDHTELCLCLTLAPVYPSQYGMMTNCNQSIWSYSPKHVVVVSCRALDVGITATRTVLLDGPLVFDVDRLLAGGTAYAFEQEQSMRIGVGLPLLRSSSLTVKTAISESPKTAHCKCTAISQVSFPKRNTWKL